MKYTTQCALILAMLLIANVVQASDGYQFIDLPFKNVTLEPEGGSGKEMRTFYRFKDDDQALVCSVSKTGTAGVWMGWETDPSVSNVQVLRSYESYKLTPEGAAQMGYIIFTNHESFPVQISCQYAKN